MKIWSRQLITVPYSRCMLGAATILDFWNAVEALVMLEDTYIILFQGEPGKYEDIITGQYMESRKEVKLDLIGINNT